MQILDTQPTPNPNALKFIVAGTFPAGSHSFMSEAEAARDPLAASLFSLGEVTSVFYMNNFLTVNKTPAGDWAKLHPAITETLSKV